MPPREEEYEYIIFRATDLKDIRVLEPPNPQATLQGGLASDPAIIKVVQPYCIMLLNNCYLCNPCSILKEVPLALSQVTGLLAYRVRQ